MNKHRHTQLIDDALGAYIAWREERACVWSAYRLWCRAPVRDHSFAFSAYQAALDREETASRVYAKRVLRLENALPRAQGLPFAGNSTRAREGRR